MGTKTSIIKSKFISHGTLGSKNLAQTRKFYEEFLGIEVMQTSKISLMARLGGDHIYVVVQDKNMTEMPRLNHNGIDVDSDQEVNASHQAVLDGAEEWGLYNISKPVEQHGTYSFYVIDADSNWWEILTNPPGGYSYVFALNETDAKWRDQQQGRARRTEWEHLEKMQK